MSKRKRKNYKWLSGHGNKTFLSETITEGDHTYDPGYDVMALEQHYSQRSMEQLRKDQKEGLPDNLPNDPRVSKILDKRVQEEESIKNSATLSSNDSNNYQDLLVVKPTPTDKHKIKQPWWSKAIGPHPFRMMVSGDSNSGKTTLVIHMYKVMWEKYYDEIYVFSPNIEIDDMWKGLNITKKLSKFDRAFITKTMKAQRSDIKTKGVHRSKKILFIFDDFAAEKGIMKSSTLARIYMIFRHYNCSVVQLTQKYKAPSHTIRTNSSSVIVFNTSNGMELESILEEQKNLLLTTNEFRELFDSVTSSSPYAFLTIAHFEKDKTRMYRKNLSEVMVINVEQTEMSLRKAKRQRLNTKYRSEMGADAALRPKETKKPSEEPDTHEPEPVRENEGRGELDNDGKHMLKRPTGEKQQLETINRVV